MSSFHLGVLFGILSAFTGTAVTLWSREIQHREGPWRYMAIITLGPALLGGSSWVVAQPAWSRELVVSAGLASIPALIGMFMLGLATRSGHVSHVAPVMGTRVLIVTGMAAAFGFEPALPRFWVSAIIIFVALFLVKGNRRLLSRPWQVIDKTLVLTILSCASFGLADLVTRRRMALYDLSAWDFICVSWVLRGVVMLVSYVLICRAVRTRLFLKESRTFWASAPFYCVHGFVIVNAFKLTDSAILVNVLTNLRGIVAVFAVLVLHRFNMTRNERLTGPLFAVRLAGSVLILLAIYIALKGLPA
ncbi:MAG: hypothetical protein R6V03_08150 [Kiritimatiellia bacterium]